MMPPAADSADRSPAPNGSAAPPLSEERLSAVMDGEADDAAVNAVCRAWRDTPIRVRRGTPTTSSATSCARRSCRGRPGTMPSLSSACAPAWPANPSCWPRNRFTVPSRPPRGGAAALDGAGRHRCWFCGGGRGAGGVAHGRARTARRRVRRAGARCATTCARRGAACIGRGRRHGPRGRCGRLVGGAADDPRPRDRPLLPRPPRDAGLGRGGGSWRRNPPG
jgi:hypothetical protein